MRILARAALLSQWFSIAYVVGTLAFSVFTEVLLDAVGVSELILSVLIRPQDYTAKRVAILAFKERGFIQFVDLNRRF